MTTTDHPHGPSAAELAAGLRALADWLDSRPEFPVTSYPALNMALDAEQVTLAAALLTDPTPSHGGHPGADQMFGSLRLSVFHVSDKAVTAYRERQAIADQVMAERAAALTVEGARP